MSTLICMWVAFRVTDGGAAAGVCLPKGGGMIKSLSVHGVHALDQQNTLN